MLFDTDKSYIKPEANVALEKAAADIKARTGPRLRYVLINGHTDATGSADYNQRLSEARAKAAADWFVDAQISRALQDSGRRVSARRSPLRRTRMSRAGPRTGGSSFTS